MGVEAASAVRCATCSSACPQPQQFGTLHDRVEDLDRMAEGSSKECGRARLHVGRLTIFRSRRAGLGDGEMRAVRLVVRTRVDRSS
jgi:hypothetical protein